MGVDADRKRFPLLRRGNFAPPSAKSARTGPRIRSSRWPAPSSATLTGSFEAIKHGPHSPRMFTLFYRHLAAAPRPFPNSRQDEHADRIHETVTTRATCLTTCNGPRWMPADRAWITIYRTVEIANQQGPPRSTSPIYRGLYRTTPNKAPILIRKLLAERCPAATKSSCHAHAITIGAFGDPPTALAAVEAGARQIEWHDQRPGAKTCGQHPHWKSS